MAYKYSLIVATLGRKKELEDLLLSLTKQSAEKSLFEVIIVDQNENGLITPLVQNFSSRLNIQHILSNRKGLSYNRNLGIQKATGQYLAVPDDDCEYYEDTLQTIEQELQKFSYPDMIIGKVYNRELKEYVFKKTPVSSFELSEANFYSVVSSITLVFKNEPGLMFNETFGIGGRYQSNEDGELILHFIKSGKRVVYSPVIEFDHPPYNALNMSPEKIYKYGIGFGAMCRKYMSFTILFLFAKVIAFQFFMVIKELFLFNFTEMLRRFNALKGRLAGFLIYSSK